VRWNSPENAIATSSPMMAVGIAVMPKSERLTENWLRMTARSPSSFPPVRAPSLPARLHFTGQVYRAALQQQFLRQRGLTRIRVGDNGKGPAVERHAARLRAE
jgi:hypothetical protein